MKDTSVIDKPHTLLEYAIEIVTLLGVMLISVILLYGMVWVSSL